MCTVRASRSTSSPARASSYSRFPSTFRAEYIGGVWVTRPTNPASASRARSSVKPSSGRVSRTRPAASWVSVICPNRTVASYSFSPSAMNPATLVASPTQIGRTPVAVGSRVPVCPQRLTLNSPFSLRTTSNEVGPLGLLTTTTPDSSDMLERLFHFPSDERPYLVSIAFDRAPCRVVVPAPAEPLRDPRDVDVAPGAEADIPDPRAVLGLREARRHFHSVDRPRVVDEAVGEVEMGAGPRYHVAGDDDGGELAALVELQGPEHLREELHPRERLLLVDPHGHLPRVDPVLEKLRGHPQALRIRRRVPEASGVGEDARIDADGGVPAEGMPEPTDDLVGEDADARGLGIDVIDVAERLRRQVMVEVQQDPAARTGGHVRTEPVARPGIGRDGDVEGVVRGELAAHPVRSGKEAEVVGELVGIVDDDFAAHLPQRRAERERAPERVPVRATVHGEQDPPRRLQRGHRPRQGLSRAPLAGIGDSAITCLHPCPRRPLVTPAPLPVLATAGIPADARPRRGPRAKAARCGPLCRSLRRRRSGDREGLAAR